MPLSTAAKAALCVCPTAVVAGTVATVPAAKRAVHHVTAYHAHPGRHAPRTAAARSAAPATAGVPCAPGVAPIPPAVPLVTYAAPVPEAADAKPSPGGFAGAGPIVAALAAGPVVAGGGGEGTGTVTPTPTPTPTSTTTPTEAVPETSTWLMLIGGAGLAGYALRRRLPVAATATGRLRVRSAAGAALWSGSAAVEAGDTAATLGMKAVIANVAGKAALCACPAVIAAGTVMGVPPVRHAVHAATAPAVPAPVVAQVVPPCTEAAVLPVSATAVADFPDTVSTATAAAAPAASAAII